MCQDKIYTLHFVLEREGDRMWKRCRTASAAARYGAALRLEAERMQQMEGGLFPRYFGFTDDPLPAVCMEYLPGGCMQPLSTFDHREMERQVAQVLERVLHMTEVLEQAGLLYWDIRLRNLIGRAGADFRMIDFTGAQMVGSAQTFTRGPAFRDVSGQALWDGLGCKELRRVLALRTLACELLGLSCGEEAPTPALRRLLAQGARPAYGLCARTWLDDFCKNL